eukprot:gene14693-10505_t
MAVGTLGAIATGASIPIFNVLFGQIMDELNENPDSFGYGVNQLCIEFCIVAAANLLSGFCQVYCWSATGERQTQKFRERYVHSVLSQEIGWFDTCGASELSTKLAEMIGKVQDGTGRKVGDLIQYVTQFVAALGVAFYLNWKLSLVLLAAIPIIGAAGAFMIMAITSAQQQALEQYAGAGGLASQALNAIRTVTALNMQPGIVSRYRHFLYEAMLVGVRKGVSVGLGHGSLLGASFLSYALGFWYGASALQMQAVTGQQVDDTAEEHDAQQLAATRAASNDASRPSERNNKAALTRSKSSSQAGNPAAGGSTMAGGHGAVISTAFVHMRTVSAFSMHHQVSSYYATLTRSIMELRIRRSVVAGLGFGGSNTVMFLTYALLFWYGSQLIKTDNLKFVDLMTAILTLMLGALGLGQALSDLGDQKAALQAADRIFKNIEDGRPEAINEPLLTLDQAVAETEAEQGGNGTLKALVPCLSLKKATEEAQSAATVSGASHQKIFINAEPYDYLLMFMGTFGGIVTGASIPIFNVLFGQILDELNGDPDAFDKGISQLCINFVIVAAANLLSGFCQVYCWSATGERQTQKFRERYVNSVLSQEIGWFDTCGASELSTKLAEMIGKVQDGTGRKVGDLIQYVTQFVAALGVAFYLNWKLSLVLLAAIPIIGAAGAFMIMAITSAQQQALEQYAGAGGLASQALNAIRTVTALNMQPGIVSRYRHFLYEAMLVGVRKGVNENATGTLLTTLADDSRTVNKAFSESMAKQVQATFTLLIALGLGLSASWKVALVVLACFPLSIAASAIQMQAIAGQQYDDGNETADASTAAAASKPGDKNDKAALTRSKSSSQAGNPAAGGSTMAGGHGAVISTAFVHMRTVSAFSMHHQVSSYYATLTRSIMELRIRRSVVAGLGFGGSNTVMFLTYALLFWYGSQLIKTDNLKFVDLMTAILTLMLGALGLGQALSDLGDQKAALQAADRIFKNIEDGRPEAINEPLLTLDQAVAETEAEQGGNGTLKALVPCLSLKKATEEAQSAATVSGASHQKVPGSEDEAESQHGK